MTLVLQLNQIAMLYGVLMKQNDGLRSLVVLNYVMSVYYFRNPSGCVKLVKASFCMSRIPS